MDTVNGTGEIRRGSAYPINTFMGLTKLGWKSLRRARNEGLRVIKVGNRSYVRGDDWIDFLEKRAALV